MLNILLGYYYVKLILEIMNNLIESIKIFFRPTVYHIRYLKRRFLAVIFKSKISDAKQIPIIINNRNRLEYLLKLIDALVERGYNNIYIIDNFSSYPPLLEYYQSCKYPVFRLKENVGHLALWDTGIYKQFIKDYYVYTDPDVVPINECPNDFLEHFWSHLKSNKRVQKIGFSLKIDDLPKCFKDKDKVINWESQFYEKEVLNLFFEGFIDTTFALYRPWMRAGKGALMYRSKFPYQARHMPWYVDSENLSSEEQFYIDNSTTSTHWTKLNKQ